MLILIYYIHNDDSLAFLVYRYRVITLVLVTFFGFFATLFRLERTPLTFLIRLTHIVSMWICEFFLLRPVPGGGYQSTTVTVATGPIAATAGITVAAATEPASTTADTTTANCSRTITASYPAATTGCCCRWCKPSIDVDATSNDGLFTYFLIVPCCIITRSIF